MKVRELEARVNRVIRELGIAPEGKVRNVGFDLTRGVVVITTDQGVYAAPAEGLWSNYTDHAARIHPQHAPLHKMPDRGQARGS
jgi:hypothetical protein